MKHPEQKEDEIFLGNETYDFFKNGIGWKTKQFGLIAYDKNGNIISEKGIFPIFIKRAEVEERLKLDPGNIGCQRLLSDNYTPYRISSKEKDNMSDETLTKKQQREKAFAKILNYLCLIALTFYISAAACHSWILLVVGILVQAQTWVFMVYDYFDRKLGMKEKDNE